MCRKIVEILYRKCQHASYWEIPSPDPNCNGIRHHYVQTSLKACKHCWVRRGLPKKTWRRKGLEDGRKVRLRLKRHAIEYPIQTCGLARSSNCPTWRPRYRWNTREWASRSLYLQELDTIAEVGTLIRTGQPLEHGPRSIYYVDADTEECRLWRLVERENIHESAGDRCWLCWGDFESDYPDMLCQAERAGPGNLREIPCKNRTRFKHVFCIACVREHMITVATAQKEALRTGADFQPQRCDMCFTTWIVRIIPKRGVRARLGGLFDQYYQEMLGNIPKGRPDSEPTLR